eukprot:1942332-Rhodomonas_salina.1
MALPAQGLVDCGAELVSVTPGYPSLRASYAMSGTDLASGTVCLRFCYAMSSTDLVYPPTLLLRDALSRPPTCCYERAGTDLAYAATSNL